jgi:adenylate cyclase
MGIEIERKFLVANDGWRPGYEPKRIRQGYLAYGPPASVRVRISGDTANLNIKESTLNIQRLEFEYPLPVADAEALLNDLACGEPVEKVRHHVEVSGLIWEVDVFEGANAGLVVAEVELESADTEIALPEWVGEEVSGDARYFNSYLAQHPFSTW